MAKRMTDRLLSLGGEIITGKAAVKINVSKGLARSAQLSDGSIIHADCIICATPPEVTFGVLLGKALPKEYESEYRSKKPSRFSSIHAAFACDLSRLPFKSDLIFEIPEKYRPRLGGRHLVLREFSHEKSFAPDGKSIMQAMVFCGERKAAELIALKNKSPADYRLHKLRLGRDMEKIITAKLPELSGLIKCIDLWTPATYNRYLGTSCGSYMSFILPPNKIPRRRSCRVSGIKNLFLATQWSMPVGGLPIAAGEGKRAAEAAAAYLKLGKKSASPRLYRLKRTPSQ
jgi:phytoene dehydrogenase-like protein